MLTEKIMIFSPRFLLKTRPPFFNLQIEPYVLVGDLLMKALLRAPLQLLPSLHARVTTKKSGTEDLDIKDMIKQVVIGGGGRPQGGGERGFETFYRPVEDAIVGFLAVVCHVCLPSKAGPCLRIEMSIHPSLLKLAHKFFGRLRCCFTVHFR